MQVLLWCVVVDNNYIIANPNSEVPVDEHEEGEDNLNDNDIDGDFEGICLC